jgi:hypothetical protein
MPTKLQWRAPQRDPRTAASVELRAAQRVGVAPSTLHFCLHHERGGLARLVAVAQVYRECGALDLFTRLCVHFDAARRPLQLVPLNDAFEAEAVADAREDISELRFLRDRTDAALDEAIRDQDTAVLRATVLRDALVHEQQKRRFV